MADLDWPVRQKEVVDGVEHMAWAVAGFEYYAGMPSKDGMRNLLEDRIHAVQRKIVIGPNRPKAHHWD